MKIILPVAFICAIGVCLINSIRKHDEICKSEIEEK